MGAGACSRYSACMRAHANAHSKGYPFARSVTPSPRMTCNISTCANRTTCSRTTWRWKYCCHSMVNWQILSASAENGYVWVCARRRIKKDIIVITIMRIIIINGVTRVVKWRPAWVCVHTVMRLNGTVRTDTRGSRSRMTCACVCARARACVESYVRACAVTTRSEMWIKLSLSWSRQT